MTPGMQAVLMWAALSFAGFLAHLVGDYILQTGWMAANKARPIDWARLLRGAADFGPDMVVVRAITTHAALWTIALQAAWFPLAGLAWGAEGATTAVWATLVLGAIHWVQDRRWPVVWFMNKTGKDPSQLWLLIVVDNTSHLLQIALAAAWVVWRMQ